MTVVYPINGKNQRMGSLFRTPKHLLLYEGKPILKHSIDNILSHYHDAKVVILTNESYLESIVELVADNLSIQVEIVEQTTSHVDTLRSSKHVKEGPVLFVDCDIIPETLTNFDDKHPTVFTFRNTTELLNYSNYETNPQDVIISCNEKEKLFPDAGAGIYYFPSMQVFLEYSQKCRSISECITNMMLNNIISKVNRNSIIHRFGTLQDIYIDTFSFRKPNTINLSTGFTNNNVVRSGNLVVKQGSTVVDEHEWYHCYLNNKHIPTILECKGDRLVMEFINRDADLNLDDIFDVIDEYVTYPTLNNLTFDTYKVNIKQHLENNIRVTNGSKLLKLLQPLDIQQTFAHGDLSIMNIIPTRLGLKLIDPLYCSTKFGSYELDIAKLCFSTKYYKNDSASFSYIKDKSNIEYLDILIASEAVRVSTYRKEYSFIAENLINELDS